MNLVSIPLVPLPPNTIFPEKLGLTLAGTTKLPNDKNELLRYKIKKIDFLNKFLQHIGNQ